MNVMDRPRSSGILCHVTSLPSPLGMGDLGPVAHRWIDFLADSGQRWWQVLPLGPPAGRDHSPYCPASAFAGNPLLVSPELLAADGWLSTADLAVLEDAGPQGAGVNFIAVERLRTPLLERACERFFEHGDRARFDDFCDRNAHWLDPFVRFRALERNGDRADVARREMCIQFFFDEQWTRLRSHAASRGVCIFGDIPFYLDHGSADVWSRPELFRLDEDRRPRAVSGVPPDAFSATGQLWGNPVYDWDAHAREGYAWWVARIRRAREWFDLVRLDHFRAFAAHWEVAAGSTTAAEGTWVDGPGRAILDAIASAVPPGSLVAEDLGTITDDVRELMRAGDLPGMKVLLFAFDGDGANRYLPHHHTANAVVYTGTHDNNTVRGWFEDDAGPETRAFLARYLGRECSPSDVSESLVRMALGSVCRLAIVPIQDVLGLNARARMNRPASSQGNWTWRLDPALLSPELVRYLGDMTEAYGRA